MPTSFYTRSKTPWCRLPHTWPEFYQSSIQFPYIKADKRANATPGSILWVKLRNPILEVAILGKKLGVTKKKSNLLSSSLCISKHNLYKRFLGVLLKIEELKESVIGAEDVASIPYNVMKKKSENYVSKWLMVKDNFFKTWTTKPDFWNFCVDLT
ncbi:tRNA-specific adenosine deaminase 1 isoform X2 [Manduca sexta]|uniref:tRNA-specific adenosine deaminase 1 isoform X2 n=1 Tax=Manduca sexta TaxID=7130 RepID=UPI001181E07A|nr:tRNA-specific adenosine deaminase 1 isoform X2 [Manduca sexta]